MVRPRKKKNEVEHLLIREEPETEWQKVLAHLEDNYKLYIAGTVFLILCIAIGALIKGAAVLQERQRTTSYAEAVLVEDPSERLAKYVEVMDSLGNWTPEALYRMGETAIEAEDFAKAEEAFQKLVEEYADSQYVPNAVDGLAFVAWNKGDLEGALKGFQQVAQDWPAEFVGRIKHYDIGRVLEEMDRIEEAIAAYKKQVALFADSAVARKSQAALDALKEKHPEFFPEEEGEGETESEGEAAAVTADEGESTTVEGEGQAAPAAQEVVENVGDAPEEVPAVEEAPATAEVPVVDEAAAVIEETETLVEEAPAAAEVPVDEAAAVVEETETLVEEAPAAVEVPVVDEAAGVVEETAADTVEEEVSAVDTP
jgi:tetratricopeptide (TPR) repeat protein